MNVDAAKRSLQSVLGQPDEQLRIPHFQRPYSWGSEQIDDLWDDITDDIAIGHFLGSIVLSIEDPNRPQVIDGQQRLTTLMIILSVLRDECHRQGLQMQVERISDLFIADKYADGDARFRLRTSGANWEVFRDFVLLRPDDPKRKALNEAAKLPSNVRGRNRALLDNLARVQRLLADKLAALPNDAARKEWLVSADKLLAKGLELVVVKVGELSDAFLLFETLNDRGMQLSASDLLKTHLLGRIAKDEGEEAVDAASQQWDGMLDKLGAHVDVTRFLRHYLLGTTPKVKKDEVFALFKERVQNDGARTVLENLIVAAQHYGEFENPQQVVNVAARQVLLDLQTLRAVTCYIALLPARRYLSESDFVDYARLAEVLTYRYSSVAGYGTNQLERKYHDAAKLLIDSKGERLAEARAILIAAQPETAVFLPAFERLSMGRQYLLKYTLRKLEESISKEKQVKQTSEVHIEHVMPQKLTAEWKAALGPDAARHPEYLNRWGNLTLFLDKLNIPASNKTFDEKKSYYEKSEVELTRQLTGYAKWGIAEITARQRHLAELADRLWYVEPSNQPIAPAVRPDSVERFRSALGELWPAVADFLIETTTVDIAQLAERLPRHLAEHQLNNEQASRLAGELQSLLADWERLDAGQRSVVHAAVAYFLAVADAVPDYEVGGLIDDAAVVTAAIEAVGLPRTEPNGRLE